MKSRQLPPQSTRVEFGSRGFLIASKDYSLVGDKLCYALKAYQATNSPEVVNTMIKIPLTKKEIRGVIEALQLVIKE